MINIHRLPHPYIGRGDRYFVRMCFTEKMRIILDIISHNAVIIIITILLFLRYSVYT